MALKIPKRLKLHPSIQRSKEQEAELAEKIGGRKTPASGSLFEKGDVRKKGVVRIEAKTTSAASFRVTEEMIQKIEEAGLGSNEIPAMVIAFNDQAGREKSAVALIPVWALEMIVGGD